MSADQHNWDQNNLSGDHVQTGTTEGGACLNRHEAGRAPGPTGKLKHHSCNYRWQAFEKARSDSGAYNWPKYKSAFPDQKTLTMDVRSRSGKRAVPVPGEKDWDVTATGDNFQTTCNRPYWHEAHHVVPNSKLRESIAKVGDGQPLQIEYVKLIRSGLLRAKYNLNHKRNMIILPMDRRIALALALPRHRVSSDAFSHSAYSRRIGDRLDKIMQPVQKAVKAHQKAPPYTDVKSQIEALSEEMYEKIKAAGAAMQTSGGGALEDMPAESFAPGTAPSEGMS